MTGGAAPAEVTTSDAAAHVLASLRARGDTLATAESLTGGLLGAALTAVPGASSVYRGGVLAYATELKAALLGVPVDLLAERGAVDPDVAVAMAVGAAARTGASAALATTGVAGPDPQDGQPVGTVYVAAVLGARHQVRALVLPGDRAAVRAATVLAALDLMRELLDAPGERPQ